MRTVTRRSVWTVIAPLLGAAAALAQAPQTGTPGPTAAPGEQFAGALTDVRRSLEVRSWKKADELIRRLLREHAGAEYVRPHLQGLREDLRRACFWQSVVEPKVKELIAGELLNYEPTNGMLRVRYTAARLGDFKTEGVSRVHPVRFTAPWTVEVEGTPAEVAAVAWLVLIDDQHHYAARFGRREVGDLVYTLHSLVDLQAGARGDRKTAEPPERKPSTKPVRARLDVDRREIRMLYDGKQVLAVPKAEGFGSFGLQREDGAAPIGKVSVSGRVEPGWINGLLDAAVAKQLAAFDARWQEPEEFQAWAATAGAVAEDVGLEQLARQLTFLLPALEREQQAVAKVEALLGKSRAQTASLLAEIDTKGAASLSDRTAAYLRFRCALELRLPTRALAAMADLEVAPEQKATLELVRGFLLREAGQLEPALECLQACAASAPAPATYEQLAEVQLLLARPDDPHATVLRGLQKAPGSAMLHRLEARIVKAAKGPPWKRSALAQSTLFLVRSDGDAKLAKAALTVLDAAWRQCEAFFGPLPAKPAAPSVVYLFAGSSTYLTYVQHLADQTQESTTGVYHPHLHQIVAWNQPAFTDLRDTLRHECVHRYLHLQLGSRIPRWLNEGLAEVFVSAWDGEKVGKPRPLPARLHPFRAMATLPALLDFVHDKEAAFVADAENNYALAWALVHFLRCEDEVGGRVLQRLLEELRAGQDPHQAIDAAFAGVDAGALTGRLVEWLRVQLAR